MAGRASRWRQLAIGVAAFVVAAGAHGLFHLVVPEEARPRPILAAVPWIVASVGVAAILGAAIAAGRRARARSVRRSIGVVVLHVLLIMGGLMGIVMSDPAFPFGPNYAESLSLPGEHGTAYLYRGGIFCAQTVRRAEPGSPWTLSDPAVYGVGCRVEGHLRWDESAQQVQIVDAQGAVIPRPEGGWRRILSAD